MEDSEAPIKPQKIEIQADPEAPVAPEEHPAGVPEGTELPNEHGIEVVVHDLDEDGNVIGWHKELKEEA